MQRILVIRLTALGDVVLVEPVVRALKNAHPGASIDLLTEARFAPLMAWLSGADSTVGYDRRGAHSGVAGMRRLASLFSGKAYDLIVDLQGKLRTRALARLISAKRYLTLRKRSVLGATLALFGRDRPIDDRHTTDLYLSVLEPLSIPLVPPESGLVRHLLFRPPAQTGGQPSLRVGISPGASHRTKLWPATHFAELADRLQSLRPDARFVLVGGPSDRAILDLVRSSGAAARFEPADLASLDVDGLAKQIASLDLLISVDTGPAHLAAALGVPVVGIYGPTSPRRWGPRGAAHRTVTLGLPCAPCSNTGGPRCPLPSRSHACMRTLGVEPVLAAALEALSRRMDD